MNVLVLNGSPKGNASNTMALTREFLADVDCTAEIIEVCKLKIGHCMGQFDCWTKTPGKCVINDDMTEILNKLIRADAVVWSFPLYYYSVPGPLKTLIDRQLPLNLPEMQEDAEYGGHPSRYDLSKQRQTLISTCGFWTHEGNYKSVVEMFNKIYGEKAFETIFAGQGSLFNIPNMPEIAAEVGDLLQTIESYLKTVRTAGKEWANGGIKAKTSRLLAEPIMQKEDYERAVDSSL